MPESNVFRVWSLSTWMKMSWATPVPGTTVHLISVLAIDTAAFAHGAPATSTFPVMGPTGPKLPPVMVVIPPWVEAGVADVTNGAL